jgi:acyl-CoA thioesterase FadM
MNLWFRMLYHLLLTPWRSRIGVQEVSSLWLRCWPTDLDVNLHMNNGRYLTLMDLGRLDLVGRSGLLRTMLRRRWRPVLGAAQIRYLKPIAPGQLFRLDTQVVGWEGKWFWIQQRFFVGEQMVADSLVKALFLGPRGSVQVDEVLQALGQPQASPPLEGVARF